MHSRWITTLPFLVALTWSSAGSAQDDPKARAKVAYAQGEALAAKKQWAEAAIQFALADELAPNDTALESALEAARRADNGVLAMNLVERAQRSSTAAGLPSVAAAREKFASSLTAVALPCIDESPPCVATLGGDAIQRRRTWVKPGTYVVRFTEPPGAADVEVIATAGEEIAVNPKVERSSDQPPPPPATEASGVSGYWIILPAAVTVVGGAMLAGFGVKFLSAVSDFEAAQGVEPVPRQEELRDEAQTWETAANAAIGITAVAAAVTAGVVIAVVVTNGKDSEPPQSSLTLAPRAGGFEVGWSSRF